MTAYRPIIPRIGRPPEPPPEPSRKRKRVANACNACREKKTGCDSARPICQACAARRSLCDYVDRESSETVLAAFKRENRMLKESNAVLEELVSQLRYGPDDVIQQTLMTLRSSADPFLALQMQKTSSKSSTPECLRAAPAVLPPMRSDLRLELTQHHPQTYPLLDLSKDSIQSRTAVSNTSPHPVEECVSRLELPRYFCEKLHGLDISFWTAVPISNECARALIYSYMEIDHLILGLFDCDLFFRALVQKTFDFCAPFLVSVLLAWASQARAWQDPEALGRSDAFLSEAEHLWRVEKSDSLPVIAGLILMFECFGGRGQGERSIVFLHEAVQMAQRMRLFGTPDALRCCDLDSLSEDYQRATAHAAWGVFNNVTMPSLFYLNDATEYPPALPIPGNSWPDKIPNTDPAPSTALEKRNVFTYFCHLWTIANEVLFLYRHGNVSRPVSISFALSRYYRMLALADSLPTFMTRKADAPASTLIFHIWYHSVIIDIFRPFTSKERGQSDCRIAPSDVPVALISSASVRQLQSLIYEYNDRHHADATLTLFWHAALLYVANASLSAALISPADTNWRFYFLLCISNYQTLFPTFRVAEEIVQGLLGIAVSTGAVTTLEAHTLMKEFRNGSQPQAITPTKKSNFILALDLALMNKEAAQVDTLSEVFQNATIWDEYTHFPEGILDRVC